jgi:hypothetical protein
VAQTVRRLDAYLYPAIGDMQLDEVQPGDVLAIIKARADTGVTAERIRVIVQQIYNHAIRNLLVTTNPAQPLRGVIARAPVKHPRPRRLTHWINPTRAKKVHSLIDKIYQRKNLEMAWEKVRANRGAGGVDGQSVADFELQRDEQLDRLHRELRDDVYQPQPVRQVPIPKAGKPGEWRNLGHYTPSERGTPQGGVVSPLLSNILLTPFDREMRERGYQLTRFADDWVVTCETAKQAKEVLAAAHHILSALGVELHPQKTRIVHVRHGFEFLGYKIKQGARPLYLPATKIRSGVRHGALYAYPRDRPIQRFMDQVRRLTRRKVPLTTAELIQELNPILAGWGRYYRRAHVRRLFHRLDAWIVRRLWSHRFKRWRNVGWKRLPESVLYGEFRLVNLIGLIPSIAASRSASTCVNGGVDPLSFGGEGAVL